MNQLFCEVSAICNKVGAEIVSVPFLNPANVAKEVGAFFSGATLPNPALLAAEVTQVFVMVSAKFDDVVTYPKASMLGNIVQFFAGECTPVVIAARAVLVAEATLAISRYIDKIKETAIKMGDLCEGKKYPVPLPWHRQKESHSEALRKTMRIEFICHTPKEVAEKYLEAERLALCAKRIAWKSLLLTGTICKISACLFITPISKSLIVSSIFSNLVKIYEDLKKTPYDDLVKNIEANAGHVQTALRCIGCHMDVAALTTSLRGHAANLASHESTMHAVTTIFQKSVEVTQSLILGINQPVADLPPEIHNEHTRITCPPRKAPSPRYYSTT